MIIIMLDSNHILMVHQIIHIIQWAMFLLIINGGIKMVIIIGVIVDIEHGKDGIVGVNNNNNNIKVNGNNQSNNNHHIGKIGVIRDKIIKMVIYRQYHQQLIRKIKKRKSK